MRQKEGSMWPTSQLHPCHECSGGMGERAAEELKLERNGEAGLWGLWKSSNAMAQSKFGSHLLESENLRDIGKQESNAVGLDLEKLALMAWGGVSGWGKDLKMGIQVGPHLNPSAASFILQSVYWVSPVCSALRGMLPISRGCFQIAFLLGACWSQLLPGECWLLTQMQMAKSPGRSLYWKVPSQPLVQKPALFIVWITHYFDLSRLAWVAGSGLLLRTWGQMDQPSNKRTHPGPVHREDICLCSPSNCAATQGGLGTQAHAPRYFLVTTKDDFHVAGDERVRFISEGGVFLIMQITFKYSPHSILLAALCLWILWEGIRASFAPHLGKIFCAESLLLAGSWDPWAQPVGLPLCCGTWSESIRGKECQLSSRKNQSLLALEGTPALIKPNRLILLIWKLRSRATDQRAPNQKVSYSGLGTRTQGPVQSFPRVFSSLLFHLPTVPIATVLPFLKVHFKWRLLSVDPMLGRYPVDAFLSRLINSRLSPIEWQK